VRRHQNDRNYLMQVVCQATLPTNSMEVKRAALQCLVRIMSLYYSLMPLYMEKALFGVRLPAHTRRKASPRGAGAHLHLPHLAMAGGHHA